MIGVKRLIGSLSLQNTDENRDWLGSADYCLTFDDILFYDWKEELDRILEKKESEHEEDSCEYI